MKYKKPSLLVLALVLALAVGMTTAFATFAKEDSSRQDQLGQISMAPSQDKLKGIDLIYEVDNNGEKPMVSILDGYESDNKSDAVVLDELDHLDAQELENAIPMGMTLISVSHNDEHKFTPDRWAEILELIKQGKVIWED